MRNHLSYLLLTCVILPQAFVSGESIDRFLARANVVFVGRVVNQSSRWDSESRLIWTDHVFEVEHWIKGQPSQPQVVVQELGGQVGDTRLTVSHGVTYLRDGTYLVFVSHDHQGRTLDGETGRFPVLVKADGTPYIRLYRDHPLSELADRQGQLLLELGSLETRIRQRIDR